MANQIEVTSLAAQAASSIDGDTQVVAFTQSGDTTRLPLVEAVAQANTSNGCVCIKEASLTIATADVLHLNTTPIEIVAAQGAGTAIEVLSASLSMVFNSAAYATNTVLELKVTGANSPQIQWGASVLSATIDKFNAQSIDSNSNTNVLENAPLMATVDLGDPTAGDSDITVYVTYRIITL